MRFSRLLATSLLALSAAVANAAGLATTDSYTLQYYFPNTSTTFGSSTTGTLPLFANPLAFATVNVSLTGTQIIFTKAATAGPFFVTGAFNGVELTDNTGALAVTGVTLDASSVNPFGSVAGVTFSGHSIFFNFSGNALPDGSSTIFDFTGGNASPTPEPSSLALLGTGMLSAVGAIRRRLTR